MRELRDVLAVWKQARARGEAVVLATVVETEGSTYRRPGARMLVGEDRWLAGSISGGCLEGDLVKKAWWLTADTVTTRVTYDSLSDEGDAVALGLGCRGRVEVLIERIAPEGSPLHPLGALERWLEQGATGVLATVFRVRGTAPVKLGQRLMLEPSAGARTDLPAAVASDVEREARRALREGSSALTLPFGKGSADLFVERVEPPFSLVIFGGGHDVVPLVELASSLGWNVTVVSRRASVHTHGLPASSHRVIAAAGALGSAVTLGPRSAVVIMTHNLESDGDALQLALSSSAPYIGLLGPRARTDRLLGRMRQSSMSLSSSQLTRLYAPVGLDLGANHPEEIALAILAEARAVLAGRDGGHLRLKKARRAESIHATSA